MRLAGFPMLAAVVVTAASPQTAQSPQPSQTLRARVDLVEVDVVVTDSKGRPVRGMEAANFHVFEDGKPVEIAAFREVAVSDAPLPPDAATTAQSASEPADGRLLILVLDDWHIPFSPRVLNRTREISRRLVNGMRRDDQTAFIAMSGRAKLQVGLTNNQARLLRAIDAIAALPPVASGPMAATEAAWRGTTAIDVLMSVVKELGTVSGRRKTVVLLSGGIGFDFQGNPRDVTTRNLQEQFMDLVERAQRDNVAFYAFDPNVMDDLSGPGTTNLRVLAENTGGFANVNNNSFAPGIDRVLAESAHHYFVSYVSPAGLDGQYHRIRVDTTQPGLTVRARHGYQATKR